MLGTALSFLLNIIECYDYFCLWDLVLCMGITILNGNKYSLLMHRIKIKSPAKSLWNEQNVFWGVDLSLFNQLLLWRYYNDKKAYRLFAALPFKMSPPSLPLSLTSTPWAMSINFKFCSMHFWLLNEYWWWDLATIIHITRQLSYRCMCEIMTWSDDETKLMHKNFSTRIRLRALKPYVKWKFPSQ